MLFVQGLDQSSLEAFLSFMSDTLLVPGPLDEIWALSMHTTEAGFTEMRDLVFRAKTYGDKMGDPAAAEELASLVAARARRHPAVAGSDAVISVPANPPKEPHNLPDVIAQEVAKTTGVSFRPDLVQKVRATKQIKDLPNEDKLAALHGAYEVTESLNGKSIVLVDDILYSGTTLGVIGDQLREAGASRILGLVATKTLRSERAAVS